jgi:hypothetical protein
MAIYGIGSVWDEEKKEYFFKNKNFVVGWNYSSARDIYEAVSNLKVGDIVYLKANRPGSRNIRVKAIGVVEKTFIQFFIENNLDSLSIGDWNSFSIPIKWIVKEQFVIKIPNNEGRLTNIRAATFYEEYLPFVQQQILEKLFSNEYYNEKTKIMDFGLGQFITGVLSVGMQTLQLWRENRNVKQVQQQLQQFNQIVNSTNIVEEGVLLESLVPRPVLNTLKSRVEVCWNDFNDSVSNLNITPNQLDRYSDGLKECLCRELSVIKKLNGNLPTSQMQQWWDAYKCGE